MSAVLDDLNYEILYKRFGRLPELKGAPVRWHKVGLNTYVAFVTYQTFEVAEPVMAFKLHKGLIGAGRYITEKDLLDPALAVMNPSLWIKISDVGWGTSTTRHRLNTLLDNNGIPYRAVQRNGKQVLHFVELPKSTANHWSTESGSNTAMFVRVQPDTNYDPYWILAPLDSIDAN